MLSFALQVELQTILTGQAAMETLSSSLSKIQSQADGINRAFTAMSRGLLNIGSKIEPVVLEMGILSGSAKMAMNNMRAPDMSHLLTQINQANQSYFQMEQTLRAITLQMEKMNLETKMANGAAAAAGANRGGLGVVSHKEGSSFIGTMAKGYLGILGITVAEKLAHDVIRGGAELQNDTARMRLQGYTQPEIDRMQLENFQHPIRGVSPRETNLARAELEKLFGRGNVSQGTIGSIVTLAKSNMVASHHGTLEENIQQGISLLERSGAGGVDGNDKLTPERAIDQMKMLSKIVRSSPQINTGSMATIMQRLSPYYTALGRPMNSQEGAELSVAFQKYGPAAGNMLVRKMELELGNRSDINSIQEGRLKLLRDEHGNSIWKAPTAYEIRGIRGKQGQPVFDTSDDVIGATRGDFTTRNKIIRDALGRDVDRDPSFRGVKGEARNGEIERRFMAQFSTSVLGRAMEGLYSKEAQDQVAETKKQIDSQPDSIEEISKTLETFDDSVRAVHTSFEMLNEQVGSTLADHLMRFNYGLSAVMDNITGYLADPDNKSIVQFGTYVAEASVGVLALSGAVVAASLGVGLVTTAFAALISPIGLLTEAILALGLGGFREGKKEAKNWSMADALNLVPNTMYGGSDWTAGSEVETYKNEKGEIVSAARVPSMFNEQMTSLREQSLDLFKTPTPPAPGASTTEEAPKSYKERLHFRKYQSVGPAPIQWGDNTSGTMPAVLGPSGQPLLMPPSVQSIPTVPNTVTPTVPGTMPPNGVLNEPTRTTPDMQVGNIYAKSIIIDSKLFAGSIPTGGGNGGGQGSGPSTPSLPGSPGFQSAPGEPNIGPQSPPKMPEMMGPPIPDSLSQSTEPNIGPQSPPKMPEMMGPPIPDSLSQSTEPSIGPQSPPKMPEMMGPPIPDNLTGASPQAPDVPGITAPSVPSSSPMSIPEGNTLPRTGPVDNLGMNKNMGINSDAAKQAMQFMQQKGWTKTQAAAIAANMFAESKFNPAAVGDHGQAYGIGQWHPDRQAMFQKLFGHSIVGSSLQEQMIFYDWELHNTEKRAGNHLKSATTIPGAVGAVLESERPANRAMEQLNRSGYGNSLMQSFPGNDANQILPMPKSADTSRLMSQNTNPDITNMPHQSHTHVHDIGVHLDGEVIGRHVFESQLDFYPAASSSQTAFDYRQGSIPPGSSYRV